MAVWVISGVAGSGKTSLGKRLGSRVGCVFMDADDFHTDANRDKMRAGKPLNEDDREAWLQALCAGVAALGGAELVLAFPGLREAHRMRLKRAAPDVHFAWLQADLDLVARRLARRGGFFPPALAASQFQDWEADPEALVLDARLPLDALETQALAWMRPG
jgi:carbohydrate kinase (thermoresistant glucokinase family)